MVPSAIQDDEIGLFFVKANGEKPAVNRTLDEASKEIAQELLTNKRKSEAAKTAATGALAKIRTGASLADAIKPPAPATGDVSKSDSGTPAKVEEVESQVGQAR